MPTPYPILNINLLKKTEYPPVRKTGQENSPSHVILILSPLPSNSPAQAGGAKQAARGKSEEGGKVAQLFCFGSALQSEL